MNDLRPFRVIVKTGEHMTQSLTLRVFDILGVSAEHVRVLCSPAPGQRKKHVKVLAINHEISEFQRSQMLARLQRRLTRSAE